MKIKMAKLLSIPCIGCHREQDTGIYKRAFEGIDGVAGNRQKQWWIELAGSDSGVRCRTILSDKINALGGGRI
jgi:hypothetical protein